MLVEKFIELQPKDVDEVLFNALLDICCRLKDFKRFELIVQRMRNLKVSPSPVTLGILVKTYGQAGDFEKVLSVWEEMKKQRNKASAVTFGCMIDACVKCGHLQKAVDVFNDIRRTGKHRNTILYTTLIKGCGREKDLSAALELFQEMPLEGVPRNTITYNSIIDACINCNDLPMAESILCEMTKPGSPVEPDLITFSTLLKGYCHTMKLDKALEVFQESKARKMHCDELVYNTLMDGCVKANDIATGLGLLEEMIQNGVRPSPITHSIVARLLHRRAECPGDVSGMIAQLYKQLGIEKLNKSERGSRFETGGKGMHKSSKSNRHPKKSGGSSNSLQPTPLSCDPLPTEITESSRRGSTRSDGSESAQSTSLATTSLEGVDSIQENNQECINMYGPSTVSSSVWIPTIMNAAVLAPALHLVTAQYMEPQHHWGPDLYCHRPNYD